MSHAIDRMNAGKERAANARYLDKGKAFGGARKDRFIHLDPNVVECALDRYAANLERFKLGLEANRNWYTSQKQPAASEDLPF